MGRGVCRAKVSAPKSTLPSLRAASTPARPRMTPHEKAVTALNRRIERLQASLAEATEESTRRFLFQAIVVTLGLGEALNDFIRKVGAYAQRRHGELKQTNEAMAAQHAALLQSGKELLEQFKANPTDRALRKEIERTQREMEAIQKNLRRGANALQRDVAPGVAMIDTLAESVRRISDAEDVAAMKRLLKSLVEQVQELHATQPGLPAKNLVDATAWETAMVAEIDRASERYDAFARVGYQAVVALEMAAIAVAESPPATSEEATARVDGAVAARLKEITARFAGT
jgi:uncharacterized protein YoxC